MTFWFPVIFLSCPGIWWPIRNDSKSRKSLILFFGGQMSFLLGYSYSCFGLLVMSVLGFKAGVDFSLTFFRTCILFFIFTSWFNTCWPLNSQHGGPSYSLHVFFCRFGMPRFVGWSPTQRTEPLPTRLPGKSLILALALINCPVSFCENETEAKLNCIYLRNDLHGSNENRFSEKSVSLPALK